MPNNFFENTPALSEKSSKKIITDPEKLRKHIRFSGSLGMLLGAFTCLSSLFLFLVSKDPIAFVIEVAVGIIFFILGKIIREQMERAKHIIIVVLVISGILMFLSLLQAKLPGILLIFYFFYLIADLKYIKRMESMQIVDPFVK